MTANEPFIYKPGAGHNKTNLDADGVVVAGRDRVFRLELTFLQQTV